MRQLSTEEGLILQSVGAKIKTGTGFKAYLVATNRFLVVKGQDFYLVSTTGLNQMIFKG
jgi:hypothetical protein